MPIPLQYHRVPVLKRCGWERRFQEMEMERLVELHKKLQRERDQDLCDLQTERIHQIDDQRRQLEAMYAEMSQERLAMFDEKQRDMDKMFNDKASHHRELHNQLIKDFGKQCTVADFRKIYDEKMADFKKMYDEKIYALNRQYAHVEARLTAKQELQRRAFATQRNIEEKLYEISYHELRRARLDPYPARKREIARRNGA